MEIIKIYANEKIENTFTPSVACIGYFDGIHLGHQKLVQTVLEEANSLKCVPSCICFDNDPWILLKKAKSITQLTPLQKRLEILEDMGIKRCYLLHFDIEMMHMNAETFIQSILNKLSLKALICGSDFKFAYKGSGNTSTLNKGNFKVIVAPHILFHENKISSSTIEHLVQNGCIEEANIQLGRPYSIEGKVIHGNKVGNKELGFPTANIQVEEYVIPKKGVYAGYILWNKKTYKAMINIGYNPTMNKVKTVSIEVHIIDFNKQIYDSTLEVYFTRYLREEKKFKDTEALIQQLHKDLKNVKKGE